MLSTKIKNRNQKTIKLLSQVSVVYQKEQTLSAVTTLTTGLSQFSIEKQALFQVSNTHSCLGKVQMGYGARTLVSRAYFDSLLYLQKFQVHIINHKACPILELFNTILEQF